MKGHEINNDHTKSQHESRRTSSLWGWGAQKGREEKRARWRTSEGAELGSQARAHLLGKISFLERHTPFVSVQRGWHQKMYRAHHTPRAGEIASETLTTHLVFQPLLYLVVLQEIINERAGGTRSQIMKNTHKKRKIITSASKGEPDLLTSQLHNQEKVITEETFPKPYNLQ